MRTAPDAAPAAALGLSSNHTPSRPSVFDCPPAVIAGTKPRLQLADGGNFVKLQIRNPAYRPPEDARRGRIRVFSRKARSRMFQTFAKINRSKLWKCPKFVTLTYHLEWPTTLPGQARDFDAIIARLHRRYPLAGIIWKREWQARGAPHWHLIIINAPYIDWKWLAKAWNEVADPGNKLHEQAGTEVEKCNSWEAATSYAAKYIGKADESFQPEYTGRIWGIRFKENIPTRILEIALTMPDFERIRTYLQAILCAKGKELEDRGPFAGLWVGIPAEIGHIMWLNTLYDDVEFGAIDPLPLVYELPEPLTR